MSDSDTKTDQAADVAEPEAPAADAAAGLDQVQAAFDEAAEKGHFGETPETIPNEGFTVKGSIKAAQQAAKDAGHA